MLRTNSMLGCAVLGACTAAWTLPQTGRQDGAPTDTRTAPHPIASAADSRPTSTPAPTFDPLEADSAAIHAAMLSGRLTARTLVERSLARIAANDDAGPALRAVVCLVPDALATANALDAHLARTGTLIGPLHGLPVVVKDNIDVAGVPTSLGLPALAAALPPGDAPVVARVRAAGAILLAKTNLATLARSSRDTVSVLRGRTSNPYSREHVIAGSSGGTAAAVAAGYATLGLGTDTGASIRAPCAHACLVGIRPTHGSAPMDGIAPLYVARDTVGSIARTVADAALLLSVINDDRSLRTAGAAAAADLRGIRVGVLRFLVAPERTDPAVAAAFAAALRDLRALGAETFEIDRLAGDDLEQIPVDRERVRADLAAFIRTRKPPHDATPVDELLAAVRGGSAGPESRPPAGATAGSARSPASGPGSRASRPGPRPASQPASPLDATARTELLRTRLQALAREHGLTAFVYPTWSRAPMRLDAGRGPNGDNSGFIAPPPGYPALTVPMGYAEGTLPLGMELAGLAHGEGALIGIARAYEQATHHRRPPAISQR